METIVTRISLCIDCTVFHEYGNVFDIGDSTHYPLSLIPNRTMITADWDDNETDNNGIQDFATSRCDGCGSDLAGSRYRYAVWNR